jgi:hypothetical protein
MVGRIVEAERERMPGFVEKCQQRPQNLNVPGIVECVGISEVEQIEFGTLKKVSELVPAQVLDSHPLDIRLHPEDWLIA